MNEHTLDRSDHRTRQSREGIGNGRAMGIDAIWLPCRRQALGRSPSPSCGAFEGGSGPAGGTPIGDMRMGGERLGGRREWNGLR